VCKREKKRKAQKKKERQSDRETERQRDRETGRWIHVQNAQPAIHADREANGPTDRERERASREREREKEGIRETERVGSVSRSIDWVLLTNLY